MSKENFIKQAETILGLEVAHRASPVGGYGPKGEVIYEKHPFSCPSVLVDNRKNVTATFMSNGSCGFSVTREEDKRVCCQSRSAVCGGRTGTVH